MALTRRLERKQLASEDELPDDADEPASPGPSGAAPKAEEPAPESLPPPSDSPPASRRVTRSQTGTRAPKRVRPDGSTDDSVRTKRRKAPKQNGSRLTTAAAESEDSERTAAEEDDDEEDQLADDGEDDGEDEVPTRPNSPTLENGTGPNASVATLPDTSTADLPLGTHGALGQITPAGSFDWIPKARRRGRPLPVPVPNLTKKSRGRRVPTTASMMSLASETGETTANEEAEEGANDPQTLEGPSAKPLQAEDTLIVTPTTTASGSRIYMCQVEGCGKLFGRGEHLKRHIRSIHTYEKPYPCSYPGCGKNFSRHDNLLQHRKIHKDGPFGDMGDDEPAPKNTNGNGAASALGRTGSRKRVKSRATASDSPPASATAGPSGHPAEANPNHRQPPNPATSGPVGAPTFFTPGGPNAMGVGALAPSPLRYAYTYPLHLSLPGGAVPFALPPGAIPHGHPPPPGFEHLPPGATIYAAPPPPGVPGAPYAYPYHYAYPYGIGAPPAPGPATSAMREPAAAGAGQAPGAGVPGAPVVPGAPGFTYGVSSLRTSQEDVSAGSATTVAKEGEGNADGEGGSASAGPSAAAGATVVVPALHVEGQQPAFPLDPVFAGFPDQAALLRAMQLYMAQAQAQAQQDAQVQVQAQAQAQAQVQAPQPAVQEQQQSGTTETMSVNEPPSSSSSAMVVENGQTQGEAMNVDPSSASTSADMGQQQQSAPVTGEAQALVTATSS